MNQILDLLMILIGAALMLFKGVVLIVMIGVWINLIYHACMIIYLVIIHIFKSIKRQ